jgi:hypothetical protein
VVDVHLSSDWTVFEPVRGHKEAFQTTTRMLTAIATYLEYLHVPPGKGGTFISGGWL